MLMKIVPSLLCSFAIIICFSGCQSSGFVQLSVDTYLLSKSSAAGAFANLPAMKADVVHEANTFAESKGKVALPVSMHDTFPTHGFPSVEYQFRLVDKNDPEARKTSSVPQTDGSEVQNPTLGQQLIDLKKAKDAGAITDAEYEAQKAKLLGTSK
jgi:hypothetical protein